MECQKAQLDEIPVVSHLVTKIQVFGSNVTDVGPNITSSALTLIRKRKSTGHSTSLPLILSEKITSHICLHDRRGLVDFQRCLACFA